MPGKSFGIAKSFSARDPQGTRIRAAYAPKKKATRARMVLIAVAIIAVAASMYFAHPWTLIEGLPGWPH